MSDVLARRLRLEALSIRSFRNLAEVELAPSARFNVVSGDNGQGKTNLLEAIYVLATSKSFRTSKPGDLVAHGAEIASVRGVVCEGDDLPREQSVGVRHGARLVKIDDKRPPSLAAYAVRTPVVVFHPGEVALSQGSGGERRRLLDRVALYLVPSSLAELDAYGRALRERQRALETRGPSAPDLDVWEELVARHGVAVGTARQAAADALCPAAERALERIGAPGTKLVARYVPGGLPDVDRFREELRRSRVADARRKRASVGPHRDELELELGGHVARGTASQGQHRAIVLALKAAEIDVVSRARDVRPVLLLDDVSSELDRERTAALFAFLRDQEGQVFLTTTRPELIETDGPEGASERADFRVSAGRVSRAG